MKYRVCYFCKSHKINVYDANCGIYENQHITCYECKTNYDIKLVCYADLNRNDLKHNIFHNDKITYISPIQIC